MSKSINHNSPLPSGKISRTVAVAEAVSPAHPDKIADRIAGALVDYCYSRYDSQNVAPKCAFEVLLGHGKCLVIGETSVSVPEGFVCGTVARIAKEEMEVEYCEVAQDVELAKNQNDKTPRAGDNGIFFGCELPEIHRRAKDLTRKIYAKFPYDGKLILNSRNEATICWANMTEDEIRELLRDESLTLTINPLGFWTGGVNVDTGLTGRKLTCDFYGLGAPLGGGNMHGKDLTKADVTVNILCFLRARETGADYFAQTSIGDAEITLQNSRGGTEQLPYSDAMKTAAKYIRELGGFEKFAEWGLR